MTEGELEKMVDEILESDLPELDLVYEELYKDIENTKQPIWDVFLNLISQDVICGFDQLKIGMILKYCHHALHKWVVEKWYSGFAENEVKERRVFNILCKKFNIWNLNMYDEKYLKVEFETPSTATCMSDEEFKRMSEAATDALTDMELKGYDIECGLRGVENVHLNNSKGNNKK